MASPLPRPLAGIRVLDCTLARAGPTCVRQLADLGADVIRIADPHRPDLGGSDAYNLHRGKRSLLLDLKHPRGYEVLLRLVEGADVLVENFRAPVKHRLRIDYETLRAHNPRLVYASISGFGQDGPYAERAGVDQIAQGLSGLMSVTGAPDGEPQRAGIAISDTAAGTFLSQAVLAALLARERSGRGQWVRTSLLEAAINFMDFQAVRWLVDGEVPERAGNDHPSIFPMGTFRAADGWLNLAPALHWEAFVQALGNPRLRDDPRFETASLRVQNRETLREEIESSLARHTVEHWVEEMNAAGVACGPVLDVDAVFADPQVQHLQLHERVVHEVEGPMELLRHPVRFSEANTSIPGPPPLAGAHSREVLAECGYDESEIVEMLESGVAAEATSGARWNA